MQSFRILGQTFLGEKLVVVGGVVCGWVFKDILLFSFGQAEQLKISPLPSDKGTQNYPLVLCLGESCTDLGMRTSSGKVIISADVYRGQLTVLCVLSYRIKEPH